VSGIAEGNSLESALDALGKIVVPGYTPTPFGRQTNDFGNLTFRNPFYANIEAVRAAVGTQTYQIASFATKSSSEIYAVARNADATGLAYRYALQELNPFAVVGPDYTPHNADGALDLYNSQTGQGTWTLNALSDRAELLAEKLKFTLADGTPTNASATLYEDKATIFNNGRNATATQVVIFGDAEGRELLGRSGDDHIYGGSGNDVISGQDGLDYLEGDQGDDQLEGGAKNDILLGQQGNDTLDGGTGDDRLTGGLDTDILRGGQGTDVYSYRSGYGQDTIDDTDGLGSIQFDQRQLQGGLRRASDPANTQAPPVPTIDYGSNGYPMVVVNVQDDGARYTVERFDRKFTILRKAA
jgi:Ca2+-binding RTX toxin-like protein